MTGSTRPSKKLFELQADIGQTISNPKRLRILDCLKDGEKTVSEIACVIKATSTNASQHLSILRKKGIVKNRREGNKIYYQMRNPKVSEAGSLMREALVEILSNT